MSPVNCMKIRRVIKPDGETEYFYIKTVELQVDTCPRYFFAIVLDSIMHRAYHEGEKELGLNCLVKKVDEMLQLTSLTLILLII